MTNRSPSGQTMPADFWQARLTGNASDLAYLAHQLARGDPRVVQDVDNYILQSPDFEGLTDAEVVYRKAQEIMVRVNGAARLSNPRYQSVKVTGVTHIDAHGQRHGFQFGSGSATGWIYAVADLSVTSNALTDLERWTALAEKHEPIRTVLRLVNGQGLDWTNLYRVYEIVRDDVGGKQVGKARIASNGWATKSEIDLFVETSCNPKAVGDAARHGVADRPPPPDPMVLPDAQALIRRIVAGWLSTKT